MPDIVRSPVAAASAHAADVTACRVTVRGVVQGVGFRPFVHRLGNERGLRGSVRNIGDHVRIDLLAGEMGTAGLSEFVEAMHAEAPPLARIDQVSIGELEDQEAISALISRPGFTIEDSVSPSSAGLAMDSSIPADVATCPACLAEILDPADRRHKYPFTNCTDCGPRYTISRSQPYDRSTTTMAGFEMCPACSAEYHDPDDRRFHAQPNACPVCGPQLRLSRGRGLDAPATTDPLSAAVQALRDGRIVALKGLGGYHLACDARNRHSVERLRGAKRASNKPFAVMAANMATIERFCYVDADEAGALTSHSAPIVILRRRADSAPLAEAVAPGSATLGVMLAYTPLHHLLLAGVNEGTPQDDALLVMTSGNRAEEPICISESEAEETLSGIAELFLHHDRDILNRADDSIVQAGEGGVQVIRRSRGFLPQKIDVSGAVTHPQAPILAIGSDLKNSPCLLGPDGAVGGGHVGDVAYAPAAAFLERSVNQLIGRAGDHPSHVWTGEPGDGKPPPRHVAHDSHPGYGSTHIANRLAEKFSARLEPIQHHHAHIASCLAENGHSGPAYGIALDGNGYGPENGIWGGEIISVDGRGGYTRLAHLEEVRMPGGEAAAKEPWRMAASYLAMALRGAATGGGPVDEERRTAIESRMARLRERVGAVEVDTALRLAVSGFNSPLTSSCGRLFDAVASIMELCDRNTFEGEAAMALEATAWGYFSHADAHEAPWTKAVTGRHITAPAAPHPPGPEHHPQTAIPTRGLIHSVVIDLATGADPGLTALCFHSSLARRIAMGLLAHTDAGVVALSGGVFQNRLLSALLARQLQSHGFTVLTHRDVPPNDGGIALGQAVIVAQRLA